MVERRFGGETGVAEVRYLEGSAVWAARERGDFSASLMEAAASYTRVRSGVPLEDVLEVGKDGDAQPGLVLLKYCDGLRLAMLLIPNVCGIAATDDWRIAQSTPDLLHYLTLGAAQVILPDPTDPDAPSDGSGTTSIGAYVSFAARTTDGQISGCEFTLGGPTCAHFGYLTNNIEKMMLTVSQWTVPILLSTPDSCNLQGMPTQGVCCGTGWHAYCRANPRTMPRGRCSRRASSTTYCEHEERAPG